MISRRPKPAGRPSDAVIHGNPVCLARQVVFDPGQDTEGQTAAVFRQINALLVEVGTDRPRLPSCQVFLADIDHCAAMNRVWGAWLDTINPPARTAVEPSRVDPSWKVAITAIATLA
jgi:enamine deaminase RidA (YjgF/YER057c/UK114 family)